MSEPMPITHNVPEGFAGFRLGDPYPCESTQIAIARARVQEAAVALIVRHDAPQQLELAYTPAGVAEPVHVSRGLYSIGNSWAGDTPGFVATRYPRGDYYLGFNAVSTAADGRKTIDVLVGELALPGKGFSGGALAITGVIRFYSLPVRHRRPPDALAVSYAHLAKDLLMLTNRTSNKAGDTWEWITKERSDVSPLFSFGPDDDSRSVQR